MIFYIFQTLTTNSELFNSLVIALFDKHAPLENLSTNKKTTTMVYRYVKAYLNYVIGNNPSTDLLFKQLSNLNVYSKKKPINLPDNILMPSTFLSTHLMILTLFLILKIIEEMELILLTLKWSVQSAFLTTF